MRQFIRKCWALIAVVLAAVCVLVVHFAAERADRLTRSEFHHYSNYSFIEEELSMGGLLRAPPPGTRAVLNLCETKDSYQADFHQWQPIADAAPAPSIDWLRRQVDFIDEQRRAGLPIFIHCRAGISRSGMVVAAYLMQRDRCTRDEALAKIRSKRPFVNPNVAFLGLLLEWEKAVQLEPVR